MNENSVTVSIVLVGCGAPLKSMGWYHAIQLLALEDDVNGGRLEYVVEPWFMSEVGKASPGGVEFHAFKHELESTTDIQFLARVEDVPAQLNNEPNTKRLAIISARTADNPHLFASCLEHLGCHAIFLEKPGASSVVELELMQTKAAELGVTVYMGFNKNVSKYVTKTREYAKNHFGTNVTFLHNNNYNESDLNECFERNSEGILKNMAIHELAIAVSFYGVTADNILTVVADKEFSKCDYG
jgi:predicted dehydrogenase